MRPHVAAVYAFARIADDMVDEGTATPEERQSRLRDWGERLHRAVAPRSHGADDVLFLALGHTIRTRDLPVSLFDDLLSAFAQDTTTTRYASWEDLFDYCRRSANPVGRLVLRIAGRVDPTLDRASDALCTALQLTNFWQDFGRDWRAGRLYVPREVLATCGASEADLATHPLSDAWSAALAECVTVTRRLFDDGRAVCDGVRGRLRYELRATWVGGRYMLARVDEGRRTLLHTRPTLGPGDLPYLLWRTVRWRGIAA
jgi:squalene synthase HpnC